MLFTGKRNPELDAIEMYNPLIAAHVAAFLLKANPKIVFAWVDKKHPKSISDLVTRRIDRPAVWSKYRQG